VEKKVEWTKEQEIIIEEMLKESEMIGYTQGHDEALKDLIDELKSKLYIR